MITARELDKLIKRKYAEGKYKIINTEDKELLEYIENVLSKIQESELPITGFTLVPFLTENMVKQLRQLGYRVFRFYLTVEYDEANYFAIFWITEDDFINNIIEAYKKDLVDTALEVLPILSAQGLMTLKTLKDREQKEKEEKQEKQERDGVSIEYVQNEFKKIIPERGFTIIFKRVNEEALTYLKSLGYRVFSYTTTILEFGTSCYYLERTQKEITQIFWDTSEETIQRFLDEIKSDVKIFNFKEL